MTGTFQSGRFQVRRAGEADIEALIATAVETFASTFRGTCSDDDLEAFLKSTYTEANFRAELRQPRSEYLLLEASGETAGYAWIAETEPPACVQGPSPVELVRFYIRTPWQGRGAARLLMEHCVALAREQGYQTMFLGVWEHNTGAAILFRVRLQAGGGARISGWG